MINELVKIHVASSHVIGALFATLPIAIIEIAPVTPLELLTGGIGFDISYTEI